MTALDRLLLVLPPMGPRPAREPAPRWRGKGKA